MSFPDSKMPEQGIPNADADILMNGDWIDVSD
jgi:hypothetical protein